MVRFLLDYHGIISVASIPKNEVPVACWIEDYVMQQCREDAKFLGSYNKLRVSLSCYVSMVTLAHHTFSFSTYRAKANWERYLLKLGVQLPVSYLMAQLFFAGTKFASCSILHYFYARRLDEKKVLH
eukprot:Gb_14901 [translate_table: standard]